MGVGEGVFAFKIESIKYIFPASNTSKAYYCLKITIDQGTSQNISVEQLTNKGTFFEKS